MGQMTINGTVIQDLAQSWLGGFPNAGTYYALEPYGEAPRAGAPEYEDLPVTFPGVDGIGIKRFGFRGRDIFVTVCLVGANKAAVEALWTSLSVAITQLNRYTIVMPGGTTYNGCNLVHGGGRLNRYINYERSIMAIADLDFRQLSVSN